LQQRAFSRKEAWRREKMAKQTHMSAERMWSTAFRMVNG